MRPARIIIQWLLNVTIKAICNLLGLTLTLTCDVLQYLIFPCGEGNMMWKVII